MKGAIYDWVLLLHVVGAVGLGYYLIFPLIFRRAYKLSNSSLKDYLNGVYSVSRVMQYLLIAQLLTGGYLMADNYSVTWMILAIGILVFIGAISGMMNGKVKKAVKSLNSGGNATEYYSSINWMSWVTTVALVIILYIMMNPQYA